MDPIMRKEAIDAINDDGVGLRLEFDRHGDRYCHRISRIGPGSDSPPLLESIEGQPTDAWPASPPLQTLSIEKLPDGRTAALLVGMAGRSHWSASIEAVAGSAQLIFDLACRHADQPTQLGSQYRWLSPLTKNIRIADIDAQISQQDENVVVRPKSESRAGQTTRWKYTISFPTTD